MRNEIERRNTAVVEEEVEFELEDLRDDRRLGKRRRSVFTLLPWWDLELDPSTHRDKVIDGVKGFFIDPQNRFHFLPTLLSFFFWIYMLWHVAVREWRIYHPSNRGCSYQLPTIILEKSPVQIFPNALQKIKQTDSKYIFF